MMVLRLVVLGTWLFVLVASHQHVVFPPPDDEPIPCTATAAPWSSCGSERFCAPIHHHYNSTDNTSFCLHKTFTPVEARDILALVIAWTCCFVASMGGIGGGGLLLPLIVLVLNFTPKEASVISNLAVLGNSIGQSAVNFVVGASRDENNQGNQKGNVVLGTVLMVFPGLIAGGAGAIALEGLVPSTVILLLAFLTLVSASFKTFRKATKLQKEEQTGTGLSASSNNSVAEFGQSYDSCSTVEENNTHDEHAMSVEDGEAISQEESSRASRRVATFCKKFIIEILIVFCWAMSVLTFLILRGALWFKIARCSPQYFCLVFSPAILALFFTWRGKVELRKQASRLELDHNNDTTSLATSLLRDGAKSDPSNGDMHSLEACSESAATIHDIKSQFDNMVWWLPFVSAFIGLLSALLGIGGGELLGPTLLLLNMDPRYSSTTTAVLSLMNSGTNAIHHYLAGMVVTPAYGVALGCAGLLGGGPGRTLAIHLAASGGGRTSIIAFSLFFVLSVAAVLVLYELLSTPPHWESEGLC